MVKSLWNDQEAADWPGDLGQRVYSSRLLGREPSLVLHGGGNTSVKSTLANAFGEPQQVLYIKGSGWDLATIEAAGFAPVHLDYTARLAQLPSLSDTDMVRELKAQMLDAAAPTPSVETILHALMPDKFVDHTHADAVVTITNTPGGEDRIREIYGDTVVIVPYIMPGFDLARLCAKALAEQRHDGTVGMVLMNHGIFSFGADARESYERMITLVSQAEDYLAGHDAWDLPAPTTKVPAVDTVAYANLRQRLSAAAGRPMLLCADRSPRAMSFARRPDIDRISQQGPATPDHVIRTKRTPLLGDDVDAYTAAYKDYFQRCAVDGLTMLDPAPRVVISPQYGVCSLGASAKEAGIVADIYRHTMTIIERAERLAAWQALPEQAIFDVEYWELEQAKLNKAGNKPEFQGQVALITGAASGIGRACVDAFLSRGAAVIATDINPDVADQVSHPAYHGIQCDVTDAAAMDRTLNDGILRFGGLDMLILNAGMFPPGRPIKDLTLDEWRRVMDLNLDANLSLMHAAHPYLKQACPNGRVVIIGSKNVPAPGPGAAAYSCAKAALNQLMRVAALEWGADGIRINTLHPNMVFDTGIWTDEVLQSRAAHYGLSVDEYKTNNVLHTSVTSALVAELTAAMCSPLFAATTAAQVPVDGGNERVI